jgi:pilus assembly protein Flp/PilA
MTRPILEMRHMAEDTATSGATPLAVAANRWRTKSRSLLRSEEGPTAVEYAVMLALVVLVCLSAVKTLGSNASAKFSTVGASLASGS